MNSIIWSGCSTSSDLSRGARGWKLSGRSTVIVLSDCYTFPLRVCPTARRISRRSHRLDRLSRNAAFLLTLRDSGVAFLALAMPEANDLTVGVMALVAENARNLRQRSAAIST